MHRDIKPDNILVNKESSVLFCDYGLSRNDPNCAGFETMSTITKDINHMIGG